MSTCQVCARPIKANTGHIAHHGYRRPGQGWQTASCMGAKYRPYEVACDALPSAIDSCERFIEQENRRLSEHLAFPPATITYRDRRNAKQEVSRPEGFDPLTRRATYMPHSYEQHYDARKNGHRDAIRGSEMALVQLKQRLADWKPIALPA